MVFSQGSVMSLHTAISNCQSSVSKLSLHYTFLANDQLIGYRIQGFKSRIISVFTSCKFSGGLCFHETSHRRSFVKIKLSRLLCRLMLLVNHALVANIKRHKYVKIKISQKFPKLQYWDTNFSSDQFTTHLVAKKSVH